MRSLLRIFLSCALIASATQPLFAGWDFLSCFKLLSGKRSAPATKTPKLSPFEKNGFRTEEGSMQMYAEQAAAFEADSTLAEFVDAAPALNRKVETPLPEVEPIPAKVPLKVLPDHVPTRAVEVMPDAGPAPEALRKIDSPARISTKKLGDVEKEILQSMSNDNFHQSPAFFYAGDVTLISDLLQKGVTSYKRRTFQSKAQANAYGYGADFIRYEITHPDGSQSSVSIYRQAKYPSQNPQMGETDFRPTVLYITAATPDGKNHNWYYNEGGKATGPTLDENGNAIIHSQRFVDQNLLTGQLRELAPK